MSTAEDAAPPLDPALYESRAWVPIAVVTSTLTIATISVCLRVYTRAFMLRSFGKDDWAAIIAVILAISSGIMVTTNTLYGQGRHMAVVDPALLPKYFRTFYISIVLYNGSLTATKLTFLLQYYRILGSGRTRKVIIGAFIIVALWSISQLLVVIFTCTPVHKFWLPDTPGTCIPNLPFWYANAAGNIVTDIIIFVLPLPPLSRLKLRRGQKYGLIAVFSLGFFTCAISVIRIQYLRLSDDVTWDNVASSCWSIGEICSGITCACLPTLRPLLSRCVPGMGSQSGPSSAKYYYRRSSGHELSNTNQHHHHDNNNAASRRRAAAEDGSSKGIMYPEDVELQSSVDLSDKEDHDAAATSVRPTPPLPSSPPPADPTGLEPPPPSHQRYGRPVDKFRLGLKSTVRTEIKVGSPGAALAAVVVGAPEGIEVKRDFIMTESV